MQSLGQAVYRFVCSRSPEGVCKRTIVEEMASRGYLPPLRERVNGALVRNSNFIALRGSRYVKTDPPWRAKGTKWRPQVNV